MLAITLHGFTVDAIKGISYQKQDGAIGFTNFVVTVLFDKD